MSIEINKYKTPILYVEKRNISYRYSLTEISIQNLIITSVAVNPKPTKVHTIQYMRNTTHND